MTEEEAKRLRVGDVVLVRMTVRQPEFGTCVNPAGDYVAVESQAMPSWAMVSAIHSVLPRPLEVGDRVKWRNCELRATIRLVVGDEACIEASDGETMSGLYVSDLTDLERVDV